MSEASIPVVDPGEFLREFPLLRKAIPRAVAKGQIWPATLELFCAKCGDRRTFDKGSQGNLDGHASLPAITWVKYACHTCNGDPRYYIVEWDFSKATVWKIGQSPPWDISVPRSIAKVLGPDLVYYTRGLICMSQSYGLGAATYFRRVVEDRMKEVLFRLRQVLVGQCAEQETLDEVDKALSSRNASEMAKFAATVCPQYLRPGNANPFSLLHAELSEGVHNLNEEACMEQATILKTMLEHLIVGIAQQQSRGDAYIAAVKEAQKRRAKRQAGKGSGKPSNGATPA